MDNWYTFQLTWEILTLSLININFTEFNSVSKFLKIVILVIRSVFLRLESKRNIIFYERKGSKKWKIK
jgi:hypothetical protein